MIEGMREGERKEERKEEREGGRVEDGWEGGSVPQSSEVTS